MSMNYNHRSTYISAFYNYQNDSLYFVNVDRLKFLFLFVWVSTFGIIALTILSVSNRILDGLDSRRVRWVIEPSIALKF